MNQMSGRYPIKSNRERKRAAKHGRQRGIIEGISEPTPW